MEPFDIHSCLSIRKRDSKRIVKKKKGLITGSKEIAAAMDLVESNLVNKVDRSTVEIDERKKSHESSSKLPRCMETGNFVDSGVVQNMIGKSMEFNSAGPGVVQNLTGESGMFKSGDIGTVQKSIGAHFPSTVLNSMDASIDQMNGDNRFMDLNLINYVIPNVVQELSSEAVISGMDSNNQSVMVDINIPVDLVTGQRPKSGLEMANENNSENFSKIGTGATSLEESIGGSGKNVGNHLSPFKGIQSPVKVTDVIMAESMEKESQVKAVAENKKVVGRRNKPIQPQSKPVMNQKPSTKAWVNQKFNTQRSNPVQNNGRQNQNGVKVNSGGNKQGQQQNDGKVWQVKPGKDEQSKVGHGKFVFGQNGSKSEVGQSSGSTVSMGSGVKTDIGAVKNGSWQKKSTGQW
ncbi:hypothetical protein L6452_40325 [Arctium lappa]|uniref:Uncharacterized protein n=1 Tax=Arctium lappa TaxID=4217 RepID=A0ACB8XM67_ARCLA|nr:hypothetical protein L6452_40325 [Arctium lappa]